MEDRVPAMDEIRLQYRKRMVKKAALVFFGIVLLLTFFSKTINNMLLPEVEYVTPRSGYLNFSIRAAGEVRAPFTHKVFAQGNWHVVDVLVKEGDVVMKGDVLAIVDMEDISLEIQKKEFEIRRLRNDLAQYQVTFTGVDLEACEQQVEKAREEAEAARENLDIILAQFEDDVQKVIKEAQEARDRAIKESEAAYKEWQDQKAEAEKLEAQYNRTVEEKKMAISLKRREIRYYREQAEDTVPEDEYDIEVSRMRLELTRLENELEDYMNSFKAPDISRYQEAFHQSLQTAIEAEKHLKKVSETYATQSDMRLRLNEAQKRYDDAVKQVDESIRTLEKKQEEAKAEQLVYTQTVYQKKTEIQLASLELELMKKYLPQDGRLTAPMDAMVKAVNIEKGQACSPQQMLFELIDSNASLSVQWTLNPARAELLGTGDQVSFRIKGEKTEEIRGTVGKKEFSAGDGLYHYASELPAGSGNIREGMAVEISASRSIGEYPLIVPNSSISNQGGLDCVFVLRERSGVLGQEYYVEAVQVNVIEQDDFNAAVSGTLSPQDRIVSMSTKALEDGTQVKLR